MKWRLLKSYLSNIHKKNNKKYFLNILKDPIYNFAKDFHLKNSSMDEKSHKIQKTTVAWHIIHNHRP